MAAREAEMPTHDVQATIRALVASANIEVIPLKGAEQKVLLMEAGTTVTITCSPKFGLERTLQHAEAATAAGYTVVPHLAARMVADRKALREFVTRVVNLGVTDLYVVGGDADELAGEFTDAGHILEALRDIEHGLTRIGVGCYPEGHPKIPDEALVEALVQKQPYADYMVSQLCFDGATLVDWITRIRSQGVNLPLRIGIAAPIKTIKLAELGMRIGVGQSLRYLAKQHGMVGNLIGRTYEPHRLLETIMRDPRSAGLDIEGIHVFSFNQVAETVQWQKRLMLEEAAP
jgi:methylenetetrahydrofolate reductase (NADPH)